MKTKHNPKDYPTHTPTPAARVATIEQIRSNVIAAYMDPPPSVETLRRWFDDSRIPRMKANPSAKRGGGPVYYSVMAVENMLRDRTLEPTSAP